MNESKPASGEPPSGEPPSGDKPPAPERCTAERYAVQCTMQKDHGGVHQHVPANDGVILSWKHEPP